MTTHELEDVEIDLITEAVHRRYGYDFRHYSRASLKRRLTQRKEAAGLRSLSDMIPLILHDERFFDDVLADLSVSVTRLFRDPATFAAIREHVVPILETYPYIKVWHAGCATGEEVYSMAIVLHEQGLLERAQLYATDFSNRSLAVARDGIYDLRAIREAAQDYIRAGGTGVLVDYYRAHYESAIFRRFLRDNVMFAHHNLVSDGVFGDMNLIMCRNVLIYFDQALQDRALGLFRDSLCPRGFLCLGPTESIEFSAVAMAFEAVVDKARIYRLRRDRGQRASTAEDHTRDHR